MTGGSQSARRVAQRAPRVRHNQVSGEVLDAAIEVHRLLGPGLLEKTYEAALGHELSLRGLHVRRQISLPLRYKGLDVQDAYRLDLLVEDIVVVELKVVEKLLDVHKAQTLTYLKFGGFRLGMLLNFSQTRLIDGYQRIAHQL